MPHALWSHPCCDVAEEPVDLPECSTCGRPGEFAGWGYSHVELVAHYQRVYGLKPFGPHRAVAHELFRGLRSTCPRCTGYGVVGDGHAWRECPACEGTGGTWTAPEASLVAAYRQVLAEFPDAAAPGALGPHPVVPAPDPEPGHARMAAGTGARPAASNAAAAPGRQQGRKRRQSARERPKGYSVHGLLLKDVQRAFVEAEKKLGITWPIKGRGHCRRATLGVAYARTVQRVTSSWVRMTPQFTGSRRNLFPLAIIEEAARILGVPFWILMGREY